jgi:hypothetical protein
MWLRYRVFWFWLKYPTATLTDFQVLIGDNIKFFPSLFQTSIVSGAKADTYLDVGSIANGVVYFEQTESWGGCFPSPRRGKARIIVAVTDAFGTKHKKRFWIPVVPFNEARKFNPSFGGTLPALRSGPSTIAPDLIWDDHLGHSYSSRGTEIITEAIQISATNGAGHELRLEDAYIVSGQGYGEKPLKVGTTGGWLTPKATNPVAAGQRVTFRAEFDPIPANEFFEKWKTFQITVKHDGGATIRKNVDENMVAAMYASFTPTQIGPQITPKLKD